MKTRLIDSINSPQYLKKMYEENSECITDIAQEIRTYITDTVTQNGGHLASSLGAVDLILAMHLVFDCPKDTIVFDVGHQCYAHKIITGRRDDFVSLRKMGGVSGFPKHTESEYDAFDTGHSSTSVSAALGIAQAKKIKGDKSKTIAFIGDGSMTGGMAFEALNDVGRSDLPLIIVLNDNTMSISDTQGALGNHLSRLRVSHKYINFKKKTNNFLKKIPAIGDKLSDFAESVKNRIKYLILPGNMFETMGITYMGPIDGHDIKSVMNALQIAKKSEKPVLIHAVTVKGKGFAPAENDAEKYHGLSPAGAEKSDISNSKVVGLKLTELAGDDKSIVAITAAMPSGTGLSEFGEMYPDRFFDVGIAEQHAVTFAAGLATQGMKPFVAVYSTFLQRAYDQILHDVCLQRLPVVFGIDRAGLVGEDGETHQGVYDIAYMLTMPDMCIMSPSTTGELREMTELAFSLDRPVAVRYNRGCLPVDYVKTPIVYGKWEEICPYGRTCIVATGRLVQRAKKIAEKYAIGLVNARFINPVDYDVIAKLKSSCKVVITIEDGITVSGFGTRVAKLLSGSGAVVYNFGVSNHPVPHATVDEQDRMCGISEDELDARIKRIIQK